MLIFYALEPRGPVYILGFAASCALGSAYGFLQGAWPFGLVEGVWSWWRCGAIFRRGKEQAMRLNDPALLKSQMLLGGVFRGAGEVAIRNPATGAVLAQVPNGGAAEATEAVEIAARAQKGWAALTAKQRGAVLRKWFDLILARARIWRRS